MQSGTKRDSLFPTTSLSRNSSLTRDASRESLTAHPLLSPSSPTATSSPSPDPSPSNMNSTPPRYVPYTPRQRTVPASVTTGTTVHQTINAAPQQPSSQGDATSKLQLMNLKAAAQRVGLDASSTGWAVLEHLTVETDHGAEWNEIWNVLSVGKATLLLPSEAHPHNEPITSDLVKNHIALCDESVRAHGTVVTLSGLRGTFAKDTITIRSTLRPESKRFQPLLSPATRASALGALPPLPIRLAASSPTPSSPSSISSGAQYPTYVVNDHCPGLPLPPRPHTITKPPLPPRPGVRTTSVQSTAQAAVVTPAARLSSSFANLFGRATPPASPALSTGSLPLEIASATSPALQPSHSPSSSVQTIDSVSEHGIEVPAFVISSRIDRAQLGVSLSRALTKELNAALGEAGVPSWVMERVEKFALPLFPLARSGPNTSTTDLPTKGPRLPNGAPVPRGGIPGGRNKSDTTWVVPAFTEDVAEAAERFQEFYAELEEAIRQRLKEHGHLRISNVLRRKHSQEHHAEDSAATSSGNLDDVDREKEVETEKERPTLDTDEDKIDARVREIVDGVERVLCSMFYDRLFLPATADDASHDEALSSRIAAVNLLDLGLTHLGVDVGSAGTEVEAVVHACGQTLAQLDEAFHAPADKASILVAAHKTIVEGLSRLPPVRLQSDEEILDERTPRAATFKEANAAAEEVQERETEKPQENLPSGADQHSPLLSPTIVLSPEDATVENPILHAGSEQLSDFVPTHTGPGPHSTPPFITVSRPTTPTPVSGDIILPLMIFAVVKANPQRLVSNLLYIQRFRRETAGGEESYCLINMMAVAEFLENVDLAALGLGESENVISAAALSPISVSRSSLIAAAESSSPQLANAGLRGRVEQQVDAIAGSANKVITGVVDTSFGVLRMLLPGQNQALGEDQPGLTTSPAEDASRPGFTLLRRDTGFSIASLAASLPGASRGRAPSQAEESGQQMVEVPSRPGSSRSMRPEDEESEEEETSEDDEEEEEEDQHDTRSIRSFESMMSKSSRQKQRKQTSGPRKSLTDRLASMSGLARLSQAQHQEAPKASPPESRRSSLLLPSTQVARPDSPSSSRAPSPIAIRISPPNPRFLSCTEDDIKVSEVGELLREYKRLAETVRMMGGFHED